MHSICNRGASMGSDRSLIALSISGSLSFCLCLQPLCVTSDRENVLENYCLLDGIADNCQVPESQERRQPLLSQLHCTVTLLALLFFSRPRHPLIITKLYLLFEGGPVIKAAAAPDATPASTSHSDSDRSWLSIRNEKPRAFKPEPVTTSKGPGPPFFRKELK